MRATGMTTQILFVVSVLPVRTIAVDRVEFRRDVLPVLTEYCLECHGETLRESGLRIDDRENLLRGGDHGRAAIVPGKPDKSFLLDLVEGRDPDLRMPPDGDRLTKGQIEILRRWIREGAAFDRPPDENPQPHVNHWSFRPVRKPTLPGNTNTAGNPVDVFIQHQLKEAGLHPSSPASHRTLIRRVSLDLCGLPPLPDDVEAFVESAKEDNDAYSRLVDALLASPRYGERWAQHWLDVIRWAETVGFETNFQRPGAWPYRDWVISALNDDKSYDEFVFEQIAGDTVGEDAAIGFLVAGPANLPGQIGRDEEAMRQARQDELDEVIRTVGQSIFGLTLDCARCHSHKFDPLTQRDYYAMQAIFSGLRYGNRRWRGPLNDRWTAQIPKVTRQLAAITAELESLRIGQQLSLPLQDVHTDSFDPVDATAIRMRIHATGSGGRVSIYEFEVWSAANASGDRSNVALASHGSTPSASSFALANQTRHFDNLVDGSVDQRQAFPWESASTGPAWLQVRFPQTVRIDRVTWYRGSSVPADYDIDILSPRTDQWLTVVHSRQRLPRFDDTRKANAVKLTGLDTDAVAQLMHQIRSVEKMQSKLNRLTSGPQVFAANFVSEPDDTWLLRRGDPMQRMSLVEPAVPAVLHRAVKSTGSSRAAADDPVIPSHTTSEPEEARRLALARHITDPDHPLTARVIVNRIWQHHFGTGLVDSPSDFGRMGSKPTHPALLDWLAADFMEHGWSLKRLHRQIVMSQTYRQSSRPHPAAQRIDAGSRLLWRYPPRRLEAEAIRDTVLSVSGRLNYQEGGPGFDFFNQRGGLSDYMPKESFDAKGWRRMIYAHKIRMQAVDIFGTFDCPDAGQMTPLRTQSITPLQSLSLLNSPFANRQAELFAERIRQEAGPETAAQIDRSFLLALSRPPSFQERQHLIQFANQHGLQQVCRVLFNASEFLYLQ